MKLPKVIFLLAAALVLSGCAHSLQIAPDLAKIERPSDAKPKVHANVAYYINDALRKDERTTPGGGGDKVTTAPYRDIETGFYKMLGNVFDNVTLVKTQNGSGTMTQAPIDYIITPAVTPNSSSSSMLTWPPTHFTIDLSCDISDRNGKLLYRKQVVGQGNAEFDDFKKDIGLSGKLAMQDALLKMQKELLELPPAPPR
jgi:hypothetical protein